MSSCVCVCRYVSAWGGMDVTKSIVQLILQDDTFIPFLTADPFDVSKLCVCIILASK